MCAERLEDAGKQRLLDWYEAGHRDLPWRHTRDPYRILVSEVMLQQTQAERVIPKYHEFLDRFPSLQSLADASTGEVIRAWAGMGYNRRALNLQRACQAVVERFGGQMPDDPVDLLSLPGIGPYTAGAIACFAFGRDVAFVDTNIRRVIHRVLAGPEVPEAKMTSREVETAALALVPTGRGYTWNQALMELGATVCRARSVACERCPLQCDCTARPTIQQALAARPRSREQPAPRFESTSRFVRGRIVDFLRASPSGLSADEISAAIQSLSDSAEAQSVGIHLAALVQEGLVVALESSRQLQEHGWEYDSGPIRPREALRYALPD